MVVVVVMDVAEATVDVEEVVVVEVQFSANCVENLAMMCFSAGTGLISNLPLISKTNLHQMLIISRFPPPWQIQP